MHKMYSIHTSYSDILLQDLLVPKPILGMVGDGREGGFTLDFKMLKKQKR